MCIRGNPICGLLHKGLIHTFRRTIHALARHTVAEDLIKKITYMSEGYGQPEAVLY